MLSKAVETELREAIKILKNQIAEVEKNNKRIEELLIKRIEAIESNPQRRLEESIPYGGEGWYWTKELLKIAGIIFGIGSGILLLVKLYNI